MSAYKNRSYVNVTPFSFLYHHQKTPRVVPLLLRTPGRTVNTAIETDEMTNVFDDRNFRNRGGASESWLSQRGTRITIVRWALEGLEVRSGLRNYDYMD